MTTQKVNPIEALKSYDCKMRNAAMVYLHVDRDATIEYLHQMTQLAISTVKNYLTKFRDLLDWAREIFTKGKNILSQNTKNYWCYIDHITMPNGEEWTKIGLTTKTPKERSKGFKWNILGRKNVKPSKVEVCWTVECKDESSMHCLEDCLRLGMTAINPDKFERNDRLLCWEDDYPQRILENNFVKMGLTQFAK